VPEPKVFKNRLHLDLQVEDVDEACARLERLGARRRDDDDFHEHGYSWRRMADPDGNEFCLIYGVSAIVDNPLDSAPSAGTYPG
jgi:hypothetical protein